MHIKSKFDSWPSSSAPSAPEEGRGKVAALLKQQGVGLKGASKSSHANEEIPPLLEGGGKTEDLPSVDVLGQHDDDAVSPGTLM